MLIMIYGNQKIRFNRSIDSNVHSSSKIILNKYVTNLSFVDTSANPFIDAQNTVSFFIVRKATLTE